MKYLGLLALLTLSWARAFCFDTDIVFPWVTNNANFRSVIVINNLNPHEVAIGLAAARSGATAGVDREEIVLSLRPFEQLVRPAGELFTGLGEGGGYFVRLTSANDRVTGSFVVSATSTASGNSPSQANVVPVSSASPAVLFGYLPIDGGGFSAPVIVNMGESSTQVTFHAYRDGVEVGTAMRALDGLRPHAEGVNSLFPDVGGEIFLVAESDQPLLGVSFLFNSLGEPSISNGLPIDEAPEVVAAGEASDPGFVTFESAHVRPIAISPDGERLFAVNTPDNRLEVFRVEDSGLTHLVSVPVGLEPVSVAARGDSEVWVVNHLSDSISIVDLGSETPSVVRTLLVGDEPRDIVFAGPGGDRAFITTAHRGQNIPFDPQPRTPGIGRADLWVFDANQLGDARGGAPLTILKLFGDTPRALAVSPDGAMVYAAVLNSGNKTTILRPPGISKPPPFENVEGREAPDTGLIVQHNGQNWVDETNRIWDNSLNFSLPDQDVFAIDAHADPPTQSRAFSGVGTILFNMAVNPADGTLYVSNQDARNQVRFEGSGELGSTVRGHIAESRITLIKDNQVMPRHLNKHLDYSRFLGTDSERERSLAGPQAMTVSGDGKTLYLAAFASAKIGVFDTAALENDSFEPDAARHILISGGGPSGLVLDEERGRLFVFTRFDNSLSLVDTARQREIAHVALFNPEPESVKRGRPLLYDARHASSRGNAACGTCHIFADMDHLAWDLGDPGGIQDSSPNAYVPVVQFNRKPWYHPMKGPMITQSLRGLAGQAPYHWRGDRTGANPEPGESRDQAALREFNKAFEPLLARETPLPGHEMKALVNFILQLSYPPNPIRNLDNSLTGPQQAGRSFFFNGASNSTGCENCHVLQAGNKRFGSANLMSDDGVFNSQDFKVPQFRNHYQKVGLFGSPAGFSSDGGPQIRGFGFTHDGVVDTGVTFMRITFPQTTTLQRQQTADFMLAFDSDLAPIVGQQITLTAGSSTEVSQRVDLLLQRALITAPARECDLVVKGMLAGERRGWVLAGDGLFQSDRAAEARLTHTQLRALATEAPLTFTCVPPGSGVRIGIDRDRDGFYDRDELDAGSDPANPRGMPQ